MSRLKRLVTEVHRRSLWQVLAGYLGVSWIVLEATDQLTGQLLLPGWVYRGVLGLLIAGLPLVLATVFVQGLPPIGRHDPTLFPDAETAGAVRGVAGVRWLFTWRNAFMGGLVAFALYGAVTAGWVMFKRQPTEAAVVVSADRIAVFPFAYHGSEEFAYLAEGIVDLLSIALDGAGELRTVDPRALLSFVSRTDAGAPDPERGREVAERFGAGEYVLGSIVEAGGRLKINASVYDVWNGLQASAQLDAGEVDLFDLVDDVTRQLLASGISGPNTRLSNVGAATTASLPALKEYLQGESMLRAGQLDSAGAAFKRAVEVDTTFALAYYRLDVAAALGGSIDPGDALERAIRYSDRLSERDRKLVRAFDATVSGAAGEAERLYRSILGEHPDEVEAWLFLGAGFINYGMRQGRSTSEAREALERALSLDPNIEYGIAFLVWVAGIEENYKNVEALAERALALGPSQKEALQWEATLAFLRDDRPAQQRVIAKARRADNRTLLITIGAVDRWAGDAQGALELTELLTESSRDPETRARGHTGIAHLQLTSGRWSAAKSGLVQAELPASLEFYVLRDRAMLSASSFVPVPRAELEELREQLAGLEERYLFADVYHSYLLGLLSVRLEDSASTVLHASTLEALASPTDSGDASVAMAAFAHDLALSVRAHAAWMAEDPEEALTLLERSEPESWWPLVPRSLLGAQVHEHFLRAELLSALGRDEEALRWYESVGWAGGRIYVAPSHLRRAEIYERLGELDKARHHYGRLIELWEDADPELQPQVEAARRAIEALSPDR